MTTLLKRSVDPGTAFCSRGVLPEIRGASELVERVDSRLAEMVVMYAEPSRSLVRSTVVIHGCEKKTEVETLLELGN